jgi:hypothetical protein
MMTHNRRRQLAIAHRFYGRTWDRLRENGLALQTRTLHPSAEPKAPSRGSGYKFAARVPLRKEQA